MSRVLASLVVALALLAAPAGAAEPSPILVAYGFDDGVVPTGPDTLRVYQHARGHVRLTDAFRTSGWAAVELRDVPGDRDFPELQGYFPEIRDGRLYLHFALLTTDPAQELNVALAGPAGFRLGRDGIALWLATRDGWLLHTTDSIPKRLLRLTPYTWYEITAEYDVAAGRYALWVRPEGAAAPAVALEGVANAASQPGSAVSLFSFIGDNGDDLSAVVYYVDDVVVGTDREAVLAPFVAPGRRRLFVDLIEGYDGGDGPPPACPWVLDPAEVGLDAATLGGGGDEPFQLFRQGCAALDRGRAERALPLLRQAARLAPATPLYRLAAATAEAALAPRTADRLFAELHAVLGEDPRYAVAVAAALASAGAAGDGLAWLRAPAEAAAAAGDPHAPAAHHYFLLLVTTGDTAAAADFAATMRRATGDHPVWLERAGDAALRARDLPSAQGLYTAALAAGADESRLLLKLADVAFLAGDLAAERALRERIYGRLDVASGAGR